MFRPRGLVSGAMMAMPSSAALRCIPDLVATFSSVHVRPLRKYRTCMAMIRCVKVCTP